LVHLFKLTKGKIMFHEDSENDVVESEEMEFVTHVHTTSEPSIPEPSIPEPAALEPDATPPQNTETARMLDKIGKCVRKPVRTVFTKQETVETIRVGKPLKQSFFRVHPDPSYALEALILEYCGSKDKVLYLVSGDIYIENVPLTDRLLRLGVDREGGLFVWALHLPNSDGWENTWTESARECSVAAENHWCRMSSNMPKNRYEFVIAQSELAAPKFPNKPFPELLLLAFRDRVIDSPNHEILRKLRGEI
jgi:hypothetical protein